MFNGHRGSVLQDEKVLEWMMVMVESECALLNCTLKMGKEVNFMFCVFHHNLK